MSKTTGNYMKKLGMEPGGEIQENTNHTVIFNLRRNLEQCRSELMACRANNTNLKTQIQILVGGEDDENVGGGRKRKKTRRRSRKKRRKSRKKRRKR